MGTMPDAGRDALNPDLLARLGRLGVSLGTGDIQAPTPPDPEGLLQKAAWTEGDSSGRDPDSVSDSDSPARLPIEVAVPGSVVQREAGSCYISTARRALDDLHAGELLGAALEASTHSLAGLAGDSELSGLDISRTAFLDTETTGLSGGAGSYAFLIGVGRYIDSTFQVRQFFMRGPGEEAAQLAEVADWIADCRSLVTFNGRSFDMPLLETRCVLHRRAPFLSGAPHLDLLPVSRRLWRLRLESCALTALERDILGLERQDDVPGWMIPYRYFRYQQDGDARPLVGIFHHNALDILSMVSLLTRVARTYGEPESTLAHAEDWFSLARAYERAAEVERAMAACETALAAGLPPDQAERAWQTLGLIAKRAGAWDRAIPLWQNLAETGADLPRRFYPFEELAKYWEHRAEPRDLVQALAWAERGRAAIEAGQLRPRRGPRTALAEIEHRIARLQRRLA
jgi:uncharacterized protein YprB with RNaseH-like and TPR domain